MAFVNEKISDESIKKYGLEEFELKYFPGYRRSVDDSVLELLKMKQWTVDHESGTWLRHLEKGHLETDDTDEHIWGLFWHQQVLIFKFRETWEGDPCDDYGMAENGKKSIETVQISV